LGWGGWWFWDPVENASFMPWLLGTALVHSLITVEKKKILQKWVLLLAILAFLLSVVGTFLVRSGILTSVHTFALDPARGIYILVFFGILGTYSLISFALNSKKFSDKNYISFLSREGAILVNNIFMLVVCFSVFLGTIYPLIIEAFSNNKISVGEPYFNSTVVPIIIPAILVMGIGPLLSWKKFDTKKFLKKILPSILFTTTVIFIFFWIYRSLNMLGMMGIVLSCWVISNILFAQNNIPKFSKGMVMAHLGVALLILGITGSSVWQKEKIIRMKINDETIIQNYSIVFKEIKEVAGKNYIALQGNFLIYNKKKHVVTKLNPENRFYPVTNNSTTEASIHTNLLRDLYIVLGDGNKKDGWVVRIYYNPLVVWIWIGAFIIFLGGLFSINTNLKILKRLSL
jgi:cytochrome c-type biogenesis protein CcmF